MELVCGWEVQVSRLTRNGSGFYSNIPNLVFSIILMQLSLHPAKLHWPLNIDSSNQLLPCANCSQAAKACYPLCSVILQGRKKRFTLVYSFGRLILGSLNMHNKLWYIVVYVLELSCKYHGGQGARETKEGPSSASLLLLGKSQLMFHQFLKLVTPAEE